MLDMEDISNQVNCRIRIRLLRLLHYIVCFREDIASLVPLFCVAMYLSTMWMVASVCAACPPHCAALFKGLVYCAEVCVVFVLR